jgi:hypothetical protein
MLTNTNNAAYPSSKSKDSEAFGESSSASKNELPAPGKLPQTLMIKNASAEMEAAQKLIAEIAVRIMMADRRGTDE